MMYVPAPEAIWSHLVSEWLTWGTLAYLLGAVGLFLAIVIVLEFLDSTRGRNK